MIIRALIAIVILAAGGFLWWAFSPLLFDVEVNDELPSNTATQTDNDTEISVRDVAITETESTVEAEAETSAPAPTEETSVPSDRTLPIMDTPGHPASGNVRIVLTPDEQIVRYENYNGTNGPDLKIYLSDDLEATNIVDLGPARGNKGNINYSVPLDVDVDDYNYVLTWCEAFGVLFDYAEI